MNKKQDLLFRTFFILLVLTFSATIKPALTFADRTKELIIDHTYTNISQIPQEWINAVKTMTLHHTGQSHGRQVPHGMENLENENSLYDQTQSEGGIPPGSGLKITRGQRSVYNSWESSIGTDSYWQGTDGRAWTERTMDYHAGNGDVIHASLHTWCWDLREWSDSQVNEYLFSMEILEAEYPDTTFIYMTDTCDSIGDTGYNRFLRNQQIRQYCRDHNKVLFDFADLEAWSADGTEQNTYYHAASGLNIPYWHSDWTSDPVYNDGHINEAACTMKAKAMWWLMARLAGWNPDGSLSAKFSGTPTSGTAPLVVYFTDSSTGDIDNWSWDFDNNGTIDSTAQHPTYTYTDLGTYTVSLRVTGPGGTDTETKTDYINVNKDTDNDGMSDDEEQGPDGTDANYSGDDPLGTPDWDENNVVSGHTFDGTYYATLAVPAPAALENVATTDNPSPSDSPSDVIFPYGFFEFTVTGVTGGATTVTLYLPTGENPDTYWKYGKTPSDRTDHWYEFLHDGTTGAEINSNVITLYFVDGQRGDDDFTANGTIVDQGAPGTTSSSRPPSGDGGGGGTCFIATAAYSSYKAEGNGPEKIQRQLSSY